MFEGFVSQVLLGYLGRYVKGIQKDQLKIGLWREEVLLENVELILEAFDYLQLPFALKTGKVGKLSIKVPWKKLGWEPIIVALEDVFICACQREDNEWSSDSVERRELAGKMAKLNAIELAKFSRRVSDNPAGQSFLSYIYAKILDNIQVSVRNVHIIYVDSHNYQGTFIFGLRFSTLTIMTDTQKQSAAMSTTGKSRGGQVNKSVVVSNIGFYCNLFEGNPDSLGSDGTNGLQLSSDVNSDPDRYDYIVNPFDVSISLLVNKTGKVDGAPQYAIIAELTALVLLLNDIQLEQILSLLDYYSICGLRERYGRYRPSQNSLSQKLNGWQRMWWHYAQESVLADVRRKLRKTSLHNLGRRISQLRRYVNLYKRKLELLHQEQLVSKDILVELEKMDKECDIDDILNFRCVAEHELQELLASKFSITGTNDTTRVQEKHLGSDQSASKARGWLNWLSLGMLGAGGTADSSSFAGVVSDEIIKDIYDATEFHPAPSYGGDSSIKDNLCSFSIKLNICQIVSTISTGRLKREIAYAIFDGINLESKVWDDSVAIVSLIDSVKIVNPYDEKIMLIAEKAALEESSPKSMLPFIDIQVNILQPNQNSEVSVKVLLQPFEVTYESDFFLDLIHFCDVLASFQYQHNRVVLALNGIKNFNARLQSKTEYISSIRKKINWDISLHSIKMTLPLIGGVLGDSIMAIEVGSLSFKSIHDDPPFSDNKHSSDYIYEACLKDSTDLPLNLQLQNLYDHYGIKLTDIEAYMSFCNRAGATSIVEKFNSSVEFGLCIFFDEPFLKVVEAKCILPAVAVHFSPTIFSALEGVYDKFTRQKNEVVKEIFSDVTEIVKSDQIHYSHFSSSFKLDQLSLSIDLEDDGQNSSAVSLTATNIDFSYAMQESLDFYFHIKFLKAEEFNLKDESDRYILCSTRNDSGNLSPYVHREQVGVSSSDEGCLKFQYHSQPDGCIVQHEYSISFSDVDLHVYPRIFGMVQRFFDKLSRQSSSANYSVKSINPDKNNQDSKTVGLEFSKLGFSNSYDTESATFAGNPTDHFPFVTICNSGSLSSLEGSFICGVSEVQSFFVNDKLHRIQALKFRNMPRIAKYEVAESASSTSTVNLSQHSNTFNMYLIDITLNNFRVHFHDSSCILGTIAVPKSRSSLICQGNDCWDAQISTEGLILSTSWSPFSMHEQLWGAESSSISPVLNVRLRKRKRKASLPLTEISIGVQHVCCVLPSAYLAMVIGYFCLPDWTSKGGDDVNHESSSKENVHSKDSDFLYKFEILHSILILPIESKINFCLQLGLPQFYCSFIPISSKVGSDTDIPSCCVISANLNAEYIDIINMFGRSTSLTLLPIRDDTIFLPKPDEHSPTVNISLIEQLNADLWIRIPCTTMKHSEESCSPILIMLKADVCNLIVEDQYLVDGIQAIGNVVDKLSSVGKESERFTSVLQFLQLRKTIAVTHDNSNDPSIRMKFCVKGLSVKFFNSGKGVPTSLEKVAKLDLQFDFSASFEKGILEFLEVNVPCLFLQSFENNLPLASFVSDTSMASHLCINFSQSDHGEKQLLLALPFLDVWLHLLEWNNFVDLLLLYTGKFDNSSSLSDAKPAPMCDSVLESQISPCSEAEYATDDVILVIKSENSAIAIHLPMYDKEENLAQVEANERPKHWKYVKFSLESKYFECNVGKSYVKLKFNMDKIRATLEMIHGQSISSIPFIQISQVKLESELLTRQGELVHIFVDIQIESMDVGFSYQIFSFCICSQLNLPERSSSPLPCHCMIFNVHLRKGSLLQSDGRWSYHGPIFETLTKNVLVQFKQTKDILEGSVNADIVINYNNIDKVMWEPFLEPCSFRLSLSRKFSGTVLLNTFARTDIYLESVEHLNLNITEPLVEAIFRVKCMIVDALNQSQINGLQVTQGIYGFHSSDDVHTRRYAPYILQNDTSLPLTFYVSCGSISADESCSMTINNGSTVQPGHAVPIYVEETVDEQFFRHRTAHSSERLIEKKMNAVSHHMISIHLDGTTGPSIPMSMDLVGLSFFEVNFSNNKQLDTVEIEREDDSSSGFNRMTERPRSNHNKGLVVPVVFEVSTRHYSKMIRLYSTVILFNATSVPLELRFDIPFGLSPKVLDPILPGQEIPLPLHLAEAGRIRWRPLGDNYLWSEAHSLSNILSQEYRLGFLRSFVCYPSHPSSDPFRCCISMQDYSLSPSTGAKKHSSFDNHELRRNFVIGGSQRILEPAFLGNHLIRQVRLTTPLLVKNYLPIGLSLMIESGGVTHSIPVKEVDTASFFLVDSTNDLGITFHVQGFRSIIAKFPRAESFSSMAKLNGSKYYLSETLSLYPETSSGLTYVTLEKAMDGLSGAREICLYVSFVLYNCTGFVLSIVDGNHERKGSAQIIPSSYHLIGHENLLSGKQGLPLLSTELESLTRIIDTKTRTISIRENISLYIQKFPTRNFSDYNSNDLDQRRASPRSVDGELVTNPLHFSSNDVNGMDHREIRSSREVKPFMYCPHDHIPGSELMVKLCAHIPQSITGNSLYPTWSSPFPLVPASGAASVVIPKPSGSGAFLISATSIPVSGELSGRTRAITFQPRYVVCNACNKDLCYKQKGTNAFDRLSVGQHSHLHWSDTTRELYVSIRFNEPGWQWSGSFLPDCLGDVQVKMRNYVTGTTHMVRVEVQNADLAISGEKMIRNANANSLTQLILFTDDKSGFMPYRIDNFSMERLRVYQQKCEFFETIVHSYSSLPYAWDEPCYPHRLVVEVPGERILGTYTLDRTQEYMPVHLPSTSEKAERRLYVSSHAEGAIKVLSIIDSSYHIIKDIKETGLLKFKEKKKDDPKQGLHAEFNEVITLHLPFIGISLINSSPQELVFACARDTTITVMQSPDQQLISFQILALQIDNQMSDSPYPIVLSFDNEHKGRSAGFLKKKEQSLRLQNENASPSAKEHASEYVIYFAAAKWRNREDSLVSFEYINLGLAPLCIELEEHVLISLLDFIRTVSSRLQSRNLQRKFEMQTLDYGTGGSRRCSADSQDHKLRQYSLSRAYNITDTDKHSELLPSVIPIGSPWQQIYLSARRQRKIYVEAFELAPIKLSLSFTSTPWMIRNEVRAGVENLAHISSTFQRGLMALVDVEGVPVHLGELVVGHLMASRESIEEIVIKHYTRQLLHEIYKVFGSAGVIGNPIGFARNVGLGIKDFLSVSSREIVRSPVGLLHGIAKGSKSLFSNTVYAVSSATTQFTKTAHKGIVAFTFDEQDAAEMDIQLKNLESHGKGILNEFLEGLTGFLQSPIRGAEKHGLPGVFSGIAIGTAGLVARPMASILEATGKTAQSIKKRSSPHQSNRLRIRLPRPLARELPLLPYSWEEAIGVSMLLQADGSRLRNETLVMCKSLKQPGKFIIISERLVLAVSCSCLIGLGSPEFVGVPADPEWVIEMEMGLESIIHLDRTDDAVNIVGNDAESITRQKKGGGTRDKRFRFSPNSYPLFYTRVELPSQEGAEDVVQVLLSAIEVRKESRSGKYLLHRSSLR